MARLITGFIAGIVITLVSSYFLGYRIQEFQISSTKLPSELITANGRFYLHTQVAHLVVEDTETGKKYSYEQWRENSSYKGQSKVGSADDWQPVDGWWIYSSDGLWFWIYDGKDDLRLEKIGLNSSGSHDPASRKLPELLKDKLPSRILNRLKTSSVEQGGAD